jgi:hypothetical protein
VSLAALHVTRWAVIGSLGLVVSIGAAVGAVVAGQRHAMARCTATPPNFPRKLSRAATGVSVEWKLLPPKYTCVYVTPDGIVRRPPP